MHQRRHGCRHLLPAPEEVQLDEDEALGDLGLELVLDELARRREGPARRQEVVDDQDPLLVGSGPAVGSERVPLDRDGGGAVLEGVGDLGAVAGELAGFADLK